MCHVTENERNMAYIKIWLIDDNGTINSQEAEKRLLHHSVVMFVYRNSITKKGIDKIK